MNIKSFFLAGFIVFMLGFCSCQKFTSTATVIFSGNDTTVFVFPAPLGSVSDYENILTSEQIRSLDSIILLHESKTKNKITLVTINSIKPFNTLEEFSKELFEGWKIDNGNGKSVLLVYSDRLGEVEIKAGTGLRKKLTEKDRKRIVKKTMQPEFEKGDCFSGLKKGLQSIITEIK